MGLRALIFDFNGVLMDDEPLHFVLFQKVLAEEGVALSKEEYFAKYLSFPDRDLFRAVTRDRGVSFEPERIERMVVRKGMYYAENAGRVIFFPG